MTVNKGGRPRKDPRQHRLEALEFGAKLRKYRTESGRFQEDIARNLGVTKMAVCLYESGDRCPSPKVRAKLEELMLILDRARGLR
jgi:DNA-binding XRE family transcriptional regulator